MEHHNHAAEADTQQDLSLLMRCVWEPTKHASPSTNLTLERSSSLTPKPKQQWPPHHRLHLLLRRKPLLNQWYVGWRKRSKKDLGHLRLAPRPHPVSLIYSMPTFVYLCNMGGTWYPARFCFHVLIVIHYPKTCTLPKLRLTDCPVWSFRLYRLRRNDKNLGHTLSSVVTCSVCFQF